MYDGISDEEAIARVRGGDIASYGILASRHDRCLLKVARHYLDSDTDAEDAVQGAHLRALTHIGQYAGRSSYLGWMSAITRNEAFTQRRRRKGLVEAEPQKLEAIPSPVRDPEKLVIDRDSDDVLTMALASLPSTYRTVFRLREIERVSTEETGRRLGLSGPCVKSRLHRARLLLRSSLVSKYTLSQVRPRIPNNPSLARRSGNETGRRFQRGDAETRR